MNRFVYPGVLITFFLVFFQPLKADNASFPDLHTPWIDSVYRSLNQSQRIAQLIIIPAYSNQSQAQVDKVAATIRNFNPGGVIFFQGGPGRQAVITNKFQSIAKTPLLIAIDGEWGLSMRLDSVARFPHQMMLGAVEEDSLLFLLGEEMGCEFRNLGIHINFAPVADVNNNPRNPVINYRSFGENPKRVAAKASALMSGMHAGGLLTTVKHFPGHGDTETDSHEALPLIQHNRNRLDSVELYPFKKLIADGATGVMVGHLHVPALDSTPGLSASLSTKMITGLLRNDLGFTGLIYTDALNMKGVSNTLQSGDLEVEALKAGVTVLLMPVNVSRTIEKIKEAIKKGILDEDRIELACRMVLAAKERVGLTRKPKPVPAREILGLINNPRAEAIHHRLVENSLTLVQNADTILPLKKLGELKTAVLLIGVKGKNSFGRRLSDYGKSDFFYLPAGTLQTESLYNRIKNYDRVIIGIHNTTLSSSKQYGIPSAAIDLTDKLSKSTDVIMTLFASPYALRYFKNTRSYKAIIVAYEDTEIAGDYAAQLIYGGITAKGKLPVSGGPDFPEGMGLKTPDPVRLKYTVPLNAGVNPECLPAIDSLVKQGLRERAFPGCQVLAAKDGVVFFMKSYGYTQYAGGQEVRDSILYDLASVTKITATTPAMMFLYDQGKIDLNKKLAEYLPELTTTSKNSMTLKEIMTHQAGLPASITYYPTVMEPVNPDEKLFNRRYTSRYSIRLESRYWGNNQTRYKDDLLQSGSSDLFPYQVAENLFSSATCRDSLFRLIADAPMRRTKTYLYSDLGFIYLWKMAEKITEEPFEKYLEKKLYGPLGATTLGYLPLKKFPKAQIAPTENDRFFRRQLVQGTVHDQVASLMGGVSGHAGLFSTANDLAKLMQLYLNKGTYGGEKFFDPGTVALFTACQYCGTNHNRRGLGFDKPSSEGEDSTCEDCVSLSSFGHTGFTGTYTWADPETGLLYIFLSNRVHPDPTNQKLTTLRTRVKILEVLSQCITGGNHML